ncbi:thermonuclease family protein [Sphingomonas sp. BK580]|uniref:thermonuclease family protein n=1 Tax=Sphingomonas sp. BK580 TaxID=2586972 RepID=UPI00160BE855|nr:hypothetical protein [Sphingomonas sp. BK580]MBB3692494.1 endonuclease YncB(thermonuclease family) [Sphingomonas sp. BK580]
MSDRDEWSGFREVRREPAADEWAGFEPAAHPAAPAAPLRATGQAHDGDTFRLQDGRNARLYGVDAFELSQQGRNAAGQPVPLGQQARSAFLPFVQPGATVTPTGAMTYGRPVASVAMGGRDAGASLLHDGMAVTTPEYLKGNMPLLARYMQEERLARLNRRGAFAGTFQTPADYRHQGPKSGEYGNAQAVFWDEPTPSQGLPEAQEKGLMSIWQDFSKGPADYAAYAKANGIQVDPEAAATQFAKRNRDRNAGGNGIPTAARPRVLTDLGDGRTGAALRGFADPLNVLDEAGAVVDSLLPGSERENVWGSNRRFGDVYANNLEQNRSILDNDEKQHEWARFGGQLASGLALPGASVEGVGFNAARAALRGGGSRYAAEQAARRAFVGRLALAGAIEGGLAGAGQGESWAERAQGAAIGAPAGGALGVGAGVLAPRVAQLVGRPFSRLTGRAGERTADDFASGAVDAGKAIGNNDALDLPAPNSFGAPMAHGASRAMPSEIDQPSIYAPDFDEPRTLDVINVASTGSSATPVTNSDRLAAANRFLSGDVLPISANTVDGVEEAARIEGGRYHTVRAPNEAGELASRAIPHARTGSPINVRGPLDLSSWLRMEGGIKPTGSELEHLGITNAPRKGMDLTGGDRLGPLVTEDGLSYDDAADRAWEAGFFPDRTEPPSINEFVDALAGTHSGRERLFRPDDLPEVEAFNATRRQRWDVEQAQTDGAPLTSDRSQPVGLDDLDANVPPVRAYEEWGENAPNLAGNIRLDKLDSPQAIKRALSQTDKVAGGFDAARRGRITQAETQSLAAELGMTADDLLKRRKGQAFNAEEALAARQILARSATDLVNMAKRIARTENAGDEAEAAFREAWLRHAAIQEQVSGMTAEAGRALQQFRQTADSRDAGRVLASLGETLGGSGRLKDVAERIVDLEAAGTTPGGLNRFVVKALSPTWKDRAVELYINSLLSGPQTHAVNILSNTLTSLAQLPEHAAAAGVGAARRLLPGQADTDRVLFSEIGARAAGMISGAKEGMRAAARSLLSGDAADAASKVESQQMNAIPGMAGSIIRTPTRLLTAEDELFKGVARRMELSGLAIRQASAEGLKGRAARDRAADLVLNPPDDMLKQSFDYARYLTFQTPLAHDSFAAGVSRATQRRPELKLLLPFVRTPMNLLKFAAERSPVAPVMKSWRKEVAAGGARRDLALARMAMGTGMGAAMYEMAADGQITGGGPADPAQRALLLANGWQPYSLRIGDRYYSYARLDPFSTTIGTAADLHELSNSMTDEEKDGSATMLAAAILNNLSSKTWLSGLSSAIEAVNDPDRYLPNFLARTAGAIAVPSILAQATRETDPILREARGPMDRIRSRVPGLSNDLMPRRDVMGRVMEAEGGIGPDIISPIWTGTARNDPTLTGLSEAGVAISRPQRAYNDAGKRVEWTPEQYDRLQEITGQLAKPDLDTLVRARPWRSMSHDDRQEAVGKVMKKARAEAKARVRRNVFGAPMKADVDEWAGFEAVQ